MSKKTDEKKAKRSKKLRQNIEWLRNIMREIDIERAEAAAMSGGSIEAETTAYKEAVQALFRLESYLLPDEK